jgi:hypothetical protein
LPNQESTIITSLLFGGCVPAQKETAPDQPIRNFSALVPWLEANVENRRVSAAALVTILPLALAACGGSKVLPEAQALVIENPLATVTDERLEVILDWVIVPDGLGSWATNSNWDEFQLRVRNLTDTTIRIGGVAVYDSLNTRIESTANREKIDAGSRQSVLRYRDVDLDVNASIPGKGLHDAGAAIITGGVYVATAAAYGYGGITAAGANVVAGAVVLAPALIVVGVVNSINDDRVAQELVKRRTALPLDVLPGEQRLLVAMFPIAPSPLRLELDYQQAGTRHTLAVDTSVVLDGMHIESPVSE